MAREDFMRDQMNPQILPDLSDYRFRDRGFSAQVFTDPGGVALKLYDDRFEIDTAHFEYRVLAALKSRDLACPQLIDAVQVGASWGFRYYWIEAEPLVDALRNRPADINAMAVDFALLHTKVHAIAGFDGLPSQRDYYLSILEIQTHLASADRARLAVQLDKMPDMDRLCHGDFNPRNTLMDKTRGYAIDWQSAYCGHPLGDVAKTWVKLSFFVHHSDRTQAQEKQLLQQFCRGYLAEYDRLVGLDAETLLHWIEIVAAVHSRSPEPPKRQWYGHLIDLARDQPADLRALVLG